MNAVQAGRPGTSVRGTATVDARGLAVPPLVTLNPGVVRMVGDVSGPETATAVEMETADVMQTAVVTETADVMETAVEMGLGSSRAGVTGRVMRQAARRVVNVVVGDRMMSSGCGRIVTALAAVGSNRIGSAQSGSRATSLHATGSAPVRSTLNVRAVSVRAVSVRAVSAPPLTGQVVRAIPTAGRVPVMIGVVDTAATATVSDGSPVVMTDVMSGARLSVPRSPRQRQPPHRRMI